MPWYLGLDTSNYTTSAALYHSGTGRMISRRKLLPVKPGAVGQRQSDAVFGHVKQLGAVVREAFAEAGEPPVAVGVSLTPRDEAGSYMPCFLAGKMAAETVSAALGIPQYDFSHQAGHVMAALYAADKLALRKEPFVAFHVSGGTTDCLLVRPHPERIFSIETLARSLDLHAGQAVDRVGAMLGLPFPAGPHLEALAEKSTKTYSPKPALKGDDCCLSGLQNQCEARLRAGDAPEDVAKYCLCFLEQTLLAMTGRALERRGALPLVFAGGVMSNRYLRQSIQSRYGGNFAPPEFSADNAAGTALLCCFRREQEGRA